MKDLLARVSGAQEKCSEDYSPFKGVADKWAQPFKGAAWLRPCAFLKMPLKATGKRKSHIKSSIQHHLRYLSSWHFWKNRGWKQSRKSCLCRTPSAPHVPICSLQFSRLTCTSHLHFSSIAFNNVCTLLSLLLQHRWSWLPQTRRPRRQQRNT